MTHSTAASSLDAPAHAMRIHHPGGPEALSFDEVELPRVGPSDLLLEHTAIGVNFLDLYHRSGLYPLPSLPHAIGAEAVGRVLAVGEQVTDLEVGARVAYVSKTPGSYATRRVVPASEVLRIPDPLTDLAVAASLLKGLTVEYLTFRTFEVKPGMTVLWHAAAGGVGLVACRWLSSRGVRVIGTVSTRQKAELAEAHGCEEAIVYGERDFVGRVRELTGGRGVEVVYDAVGASTFLGSLDVLARRGLLVSFGNASGKAPAIDPLELSRRASLYLTRPTLFDYIATRAELENAGARVFDALATGAIASPTPTTFRLRDAASAHEALERRATTGALVLLP